MGELCVAGRSRGSRGRSGGRGSTCDQSSENKQLALINHLYQLTVVFSLPTFPSWAIWSISLGAPNVPLSTLLCLYAVCEGVETASWVVLLYRIPRPWGLLGTADQNNLSSSLLYSMNFP